MIWQLVINSLCRRSSDDEVEIGNAKVMTQKILQDLYTYLCVLIGDYCSSAPRA